MKTILKTSLVAVSCAMMALCFVGCKANTYSRELKAEKKQIANYIERKGIVLSDTLPSVESAWPESVYVDLGVLAGYDYLYFHLSKAGDKSVGEVKSGDNVLLRYKKYTLVDEPDTISTWTTNEAPYPTEFVFSSTIPSNCCTAWMVAAKYMQYTEAECKIICPSKLGFDTDQTNVEAFVYDLKMKLQKY